MATKNDLIEAQNFSRRRLLTAFVSGAPGGKELEPASPLRAVFVAIALTIAVILVGVFWGLIRPGLPDGWQNGRLVIAEDTGARYVTVDGVLHPVINTSSARLLIPASDFAIVSTDQGSLADVELGSTLGIVGAPDTLPPSDFLINAGWTACVADDAALDVRVGGTQAAKETASAVVVTTGKDYFVIAGDRRYQVPAGDAQRVLPAIGLAVEAPRLVDASWLNLFDQGSELSPIVVSNASTALPGGREVGEVVYVEGRPDERFLVQADNTMTAITPLQWEMYALSSNGGNATAISPNDVLEIGAPSQDVRGRDWPADRFVALDDGERPCALLFADDLGARTILAAQPATTEVVPGVQVEAGRGALVRAGGRGDQGAAILTLIDGTGTAYALPGATDETVERLGYTDEVVGEADAGWIALFATGPALTEEAAGRTPSSSSAAG